MITSVLALVLETSVSISGTIVTIRPTQEPGAVAEIEMKNLKANDNKDNRDYGLTLGNLQVPFTFEWESGPAGADSIHVMPPEGMICKPASCSLEVLEDDSGTLYLYDWEGM